MAKGNKGPTLPHANKYTWQPGHNPGFRQGKNRCEHTDWHYEGEGRLKVCNRCLKIIEDKRGGGGLEVKDAG